jgi:ABC-2 type transport system ATP-binding protein
MAGGRLTDALTMAVQAIRLRGPPRDAGYDADEVSTRTAKSAMRRHEMAAVIEVAGLTKRYGGQAVVDDISFHVDQGEIFGILGPNGAGKTTTVECLEGLRRRDSGQVRILGLDPRTDAHRLHQRIGVQLQETQLPEKLQVREALDMYASFYPDPADWRELLERWGLTSKSGTAFANLSGGQKQRLFIALALVGNPQVVFLDELTAGLDPGARRATWDLISQVRDGGVTVVLVSHFMDEVEELCDRVAILDRGRIAALDTPAGLVDRVAARYRVRFRPMAPIEEQSLAALPGVMSVVKHGTTVDVSGTGDFASAVTAELARRQVVVADLRIEGRSLDSAYVALTGRSMET